MTKQSMYLVIRCDRTCRIAKRPRIAGDEVAIPVDLIFPDTWGKILRQQRIELQVPDFAPEVADREDPT